MICVRPMRPAQFKRSAQDPRGQSAEIRDQKNAIGGVIFLGRMRGGIGHDRTGGRYWDARGDYFGRGSFFGRRSPQIGNADRAQIFFIVGSRFLTRIGTSACFAAAGSARIEGVGDYRWLR